MTKKRKVKSPPLNRNEIWREKSESIINLAGVSASINGHHNVNYYDCCGVLFPRDPPSSHVGNACQI
jgi:hypothetical protein